MIFTTYLFAAQMFGDLGLPLKSILRTDCLSDTKFNVEKIEDTVQFPLDSQFFGWYLSDSDTQVSLHISVCVANSKPGSFNLKVFRGAGGEEHSSKPFSNFPLGKGFDSDDSDVHGNYEIVGDHERVYATLRGYSRQDKDGFFSASKFDKSKFLKNTEKLLRTVYSGTVAARTSLCEPTVIGSAKVATRVDLFGEAQFLQLSQWAAAKSWTVGSLASDSTLTLSKGDHTIILYLGGHQCKVDGKEQEMGEPMINVDGTAIFVPYSLDGIAQKL